MSVDEYSDLHQSFYDQAQIIHKIIYLKIFTSTAVKFSTGWCPPVISWFINPINIYEL